MPPAGTQGRGRTGRYSYEEIVLEIARALGRLEPGTQKDLAQHLGLSESQMSHRLRGKHARFSLEMIGVIADYLRAPAGWPFVKWQEAEALESARHR